MNKTWPLLAAAAALVALLFYLSSTGRKAPNIPQDDVHRILASQESCPACHAPGSQSPLKPNHPPKEQCLICHKTVQ